jgi:hypothetical protein
MLGGALGPSARRVVCSPVPAWGVTTQGVPADAGAPAVKPRSLPCTAVEPFLLRKVRAACGTCGGVSRSKDGSGSSPVREAASEVAPHGCDERVEDSRLGAIGLFPVRPPAPGYAARRASNRGGLRPANVPYTPTRWSIGNHSIGIADQRVASLRRRQVLVPLWEKRSARCGQ